MHPTGVATATWVFASEPSKTPFYLGGGLPAAWAVLLGAFGFTHPDFPGPAVASRMVMVTSAVLVAATLTTAVTTAGEAVTTESRTDRLGGADERTELEC
jgi:protein-S-isoprenylcysteine O-methyltransferase Ste14